MVYAIVADGELDQVCETLAQAKREKKDLTNLGCAVRIKEFNSEAELYNYYETKRR